MKKDLFKVRLFSLAGLLGFMLTLASCANEEVVQKATNTDNDNNKNLTTFSTGGPESRTSMDYSTGDFYWEAGDYIYVKDDNNVWRRSNNTPTAKTARFSFIVPGKFTDKTSYKVYYPGKNGYQDRVTIPANQTQTEPNTTTHFGVSGDCGIATATRVASMAKFEFKLDHQAAYLVFQPYTSNTVLRDCYITKIEVNSDKDIASTYTLDPTTGELTGTGAGKQIVLTTKGGGAYINGFPLTNTSASVATNGAFVIIKPGTHTLKIRYWIKDKITNVEGTITKILSAHTFDKNRYYNMLASLDIRDYHAGHNYFLWDAKQNYWYGHEWDSANPWQSVNKSNPNYPKGPSDSRWHSVVYPGYGIRNDAVNSCAVCPNANEMAWYVLNGDIRVDRDEVWSNMGHLFKGGLWIKKKSNIPGFNNAVSPMGVDLRTHAQRVMKTPSHDLPPANEINNYFYLPALGNYAYGLYRIGSIGYWTSTGGPGTRNFDAYFLVTGGNYDNLDLNVNLRERWAYIALPFSYFGDN